MGILGPQIRLGEIGSLTFSFIYWTANLFNRIQWYCNKKRYKKY